MVVPPVYIAGVGISHLNGRANESNIEALAISAGTKALLDAGVSYGDVKHSVACFLGDDLKVSKRVFQSFGETGAPITKIECHSGMFIARQLVRSGTADCVLVIGFDQEKPARKPLFGIGGKVAAVGVVLVGAHFLQAHAFLKDAAAVIKGAKVASPVHSQSDQTARETLSTKIAIQGALAQAELRPEDIQIVELRHGSNMGVQQALGALNVTEDGHATPISHPFIGSTGLAGLCELMWQLRGWTRDRSVTGANNALQYTLGPDGTAYVTILARSDGFPSPKWEVIEHLRDGRERLGYNPAFENKGITKEDWIAIKARDAFIPAETPKRLSLPIKGGDRATLHERNAWARL